MAFHHNNSVLVKNINGTSQDRYKIGALHSKFIAQGGVDSERCQVKDCHNRGSATAHVKKTDGRRDDDWWLCWVCAAHNNPYHTEPYALRVNARLVRVRDITST